ncbi:glycosyl hydrolase family 28-related protein [Halosimplex amylolyticum]|uniref:glycosyl hydrolase family 28-related protein n=1 Tax=Halosimplex amylolyticum TaxID=3396616 RepID=UPI003F579948
MTQRVARREVLRAIGALGAAGTADAATAADATTADGDHLGETWDGSPDTNHGLKIDVGGTKHALDLRAQASDATTLFSRASADSGSTIGVQGTAVSSSGKGVFGFAPADSGPSIGVKGVSNSTGGRGLYGYVTADSGWTRGVEGKVNSSGGSGVYGEAAATSGTAVGVEGHSEAADGVGVKGTAGSTDGLGLYTPDDAAVDGALRATTHRTAAHPRADVTAHGAAGDGNTDDTEAIRQARDAVDAGDVVFFPPGTYLVSESIDRKGRAFVGASPFESTIEAESGGSWRTGGADIATAVCYDRETDESVCRSLGVDVNGEDAAGIACFGGRRLRLTGNYVRNGADSGVQFWGNDVSGVADCVDGTIARNVVENCTWNLVLDGSCRNCAVEQNVSRNASRRHVSCDAAQSADGRPAAGCRVAGNGCAGASGDPGVGPGAIQIRRGAGTDVQIVDNVVRDWPAEGVKAEDASLIANNVLTGDSETLQRAILLDGTRSGLLVEGNVIEDANVGIAAKSGTDPAVICDNVGRNLGDPEEIDGPYTDEWVVADNYRYESGGRGGARLARVTASGTVTLSSGTTAETWEFPTELFQAPEATDVDVRPTSSLGNATHWWVSNFEKTSLDVAVDADPAQDVTFAVTVDIGGSD